MKLLTNININKSGLVDEVLDTALVVNIMTLIRTLKCTI